MKKYLYIILLLLPIMILLFNNNRISELDEKTYLSVLIDGEEKNYFPTKGKYYVNASCTNGTAKWNYDDWKLEVKNMTNQGQCVIGFSSVVTDNFASYIIRLANTEQGIGKIINENGYRYQGKNPNNYVLFNKELWRVIGVFGASDHGLNNQYLVKIIKEESIGGIVWAKNNVNDWNSSSLKSLLNNNYYNGTNESTLTNCYGSGTTLPASCNFSVTGITDSTYRTMIENVTWRLGGMNNLLFNAYTIYQFERGNTVYSQRPTTGQGYIGLMYPSDYAYAVLASSCSRNTLLDQYNSAACASQNWLFGQGYELMLSPISANATDNVTLRGNGNLSYYKTSERSVVRPVLYLKSNTMKLSGSGTVLDPYIIIGN